MSQENSKHYFMLLRPGFHAGIQPRVVSYCDVIFAQTLSDVRRWLAGYKRVVSDRDVSMHSLLQHSILPIAAKC